MPLTAAGPSRVLMSVDAVGGVWTYALELADGLSLAGTDVVLAVLGPAPSPEQLAHAARIQRLTVVSTDLPLDWTASNESELDDVATELQALARRYEADIVHLNAPAHAGGSAWNVPIVVVAHSCVATWWHALREGPLPEDLEWRARRTRDGLKIADAAIAPTRSFVRHLQAVYGDVAITVVHNGINAASARDQSSKDTFLTAGRLWDPAKNMAVLDQAAGAPGVMVRAAGPVAGPNGERATFNHLELLGSLDRKELARWYDRASVFISVSKYEPFGLAALESAQAGAALVLSDIPTFRELWKGAALFVDADDATTLSEALTQLNSHTLLRENLAYRAAERAQNYTRLRMVKGTLAVYRRVLRNRAEPARVRSVA